MMLLKALCVFVIFQYFVGRVPAEDLNSITEGFNNCSCVFYYQCDENGFIITSGEGLFNTRAGSGDESEEKESRRILCDGGKFKGEWVCCKHKPGDENKPPVTTWTNTQTVSTTLTTSPATAAPIIKTRKSLHCGKPRPVINIRVLTEDDESTPLEGEFPWLAAIYRKDASSGRWKHHKVGSLIHPEVILTGAHVVGRYKPYELKVILNGKIELSEIGDNAAQERNVDEIIKHPEFNSGTLYNDVALLILQKPYNTTTTPGINTICLSPEIPYDNKNCFVAGWGEIRSGERNSRILQKVELPTHSREKCEAMLQKTRLGPTYNFHESFMCAGGDEGKDACKGDGGSPLVCPSGTASTMYQVGIVAYGIGCGKKGVPGIYADVANLHTWIITTLKEYNITI